jgi:hypothetical protein
VTAVSVGRGSSILVSSPEAENISVACTTRFIKRRTGSPNVSAISLEPGFKDG